MRIWQQRPEIIADILVDDFEDGDEKYSFLHILYYVYDRNAVQLIALIFYFSYFFKEKHGFIIQT